MMELNGKVAVVTGGGSGIGAEIVRQLAGHGADVVISDINLAAAEAVQSAVVAQGHKAIAVKHDVTSGAAAAALVARAEAELGPIDILVNNAGVSGNSPFLEMTEEEWDRVLDINLKGHFLTTRAVLPGMVARSYGRVINLSSICGKQGFPNIAHYCSSKFAIIGFTQSLAKEFAAAGVTVNSICPGIIDTPINNFVVNRIAGDAGLSRDAAWLDLVSKIPQGHPQTALDVARMALYLASDWAANMTGGSYHVDGGCVMA
jgi:meso-butanediol dehydrogenase / (S,S)-butanediol dehydrogenase / diacetyl reductase